MEPIKTYKDFWPFYLKEHSNKTNRILHYIGTTMTIPCLIQFIRTGDWKWIPIGLVLGYGFAWVGHFFVEKNKPASFKYPLWSFISDYRMWFNAITSPFRK